MSDERHYGVQCERTMIPVQTAMARPQYVYGTMSP